MNAEQGRQFLAALGTKVDSSSPEWLRARCPLAPWTHPSGGDSSPSFGLTIDESKHSTYHCFTCSTGSPEQLIQAMELHSDYGRDARGRQIDLAKAREILDNESLVVVPLPSYSEFGAEPSKVFVPWDESALDIFPRASMIPKAMAYVMWRGFPQTVMDHFDLRVDLYRDMLVFPYRDVNGRLAGMRGRLMDFGQPMFYLDEKGEQKRCNKHHDYTLGGQNNSYFCWYGEPVLDVGGTVVVVEGQVDKMRVDQVYPRVVANMTAKPSQKKLEKLAYASQVIFLLDNDTTGTNATEIWAKKLRDLGTQVGFLSIEGAPKAQHFIERDGPGDPKDPDEVDLNWLRNQLQPYI